MAEVSNRHLGGREATADHHAGAFNEAAGLHPVFFRRQRQQVGHGVGNHDLSDADGAVQPGQGVHPVHHAFTGAQRPPQLIQDHEVVPARFQTGVREGVGDVDGAEPVGPAREQNGSLEVGFGLVNAGDIEDDGAVAHHGVGGVPGEDFAELPAAGQAQQGCFQRPGFLQVDVHVAAVQCDLAQLIGGGDDHVQKVFQDRDTVEPVIEDPQGTVQDGLFLIGGRVVPTDGDQGDNHGQAPAVRVGADPGGVLMVAAVFEQLRGFDGLAGIEDVQVADAAAELDDLAAERLDRFDVLAFEVPQDQWVDAVCGESNEHPAYHGGLSQPRLAQDERGRVGNQACPLEPADRVAADRGPGFLVASERDADHGRGRPGGKRPQPADLDRGSPVFLHGRDELGHAAAASGPAPGRGPGLARFLLSLLLRRGLDRRCSLPGAGRVKSFI